ncbi:MAG: energy transducer TonB [Gammaproteobacteria bacterium]
MSISLRSYSVTTHPVTACAVIALLAVFIAILDILLVPALANAQMSDDIQVYALKSDRGALHQTSRLLAKSGEASPRGPLAEPQVVLLPQPVYPRAARAARQEGRVMVCFTLDERGRVRLPAVLSSTDEVFDAAVLDAVTAARFKPARLDNRPVRSTACRTFRFVLR